MVRRAHRDCRSRDGGSSPPGDARTGRRARKPEAGVLDVVGHERPGRSLGSHRPIELVDLGEIVLCGADSAV